MSDISRGRRRLRTVKALLDEERALLLTGAIDKIVALEPRRTAAIAGLDAITAAAAEELDDLILAVRAAAARNQVLLQAWLEGARAARETLEGAARSHGLGAYRPDGSRITEGATRGTVRSRA